MKFDITIDLNDVEEKLMLEDVDGYDYSGERQCLIIQKGTHTKIIPSKRILEIEVVAIGEDILEMIEKGVKS
jgi:hypothetical protein